MASSYYELSGIAMWAKLFKPDEKYKNWQIQVYLDDESMKLYDDSGMTMQKKVDERGTFITFRRPEAKVIKDELVKFEPPVVVDAEGNKFDELVGNGSHVTIKVIVYDTMKGKGHRLEKVRVNKLVPYVKPVASAVSSDPGVSRGAPATATGAKTALKAVPF